MKKHPLHRFTCFYNTCLYWFFCFNKINLFCTIYTYLDKNSRCFNCPCSFRNIQYLCFGGESGVNIDRAINSIRVNITSFTRWFRIEHIVEHIFFLLFQNRQSDKPPSSLFHIYFQLRKGNPLFHI